MTSTHAVRDVKREHNFSRPDKYEESRQSIREVEQAVSHSYEMREEAVENCFAARHLRDTGSKAKPGLVSAAIGQRRPSKGKSTYVLIDSGACTSGVRAIRLRVHDSSPRRWSVEAETH